MKKDNIFDSKYKTHDFVFDGVASVFDDMVSRSVPMYKESMMAEYLCLKVLLNQIVEFMI